MLKTNSRVKNIAINATTGGISKILIFVVQFICRTIFINILNTEYLGINGLFTNILNILSFAELGIGNAIIFKLYKPIAEEDKEKIKTYVNFYKKAYIIIGSIILLLGICIIPFLELIINNPPDIKENLVLIYVLFLINSSISYFFTYKRSIIVGYQKGYVVNIIEFIITIIQNILQIITLLLTHNYILYLILQIICTALINIISSIVANKLYPYIKDKKYAKISKQEERNIFKDVKSIIFYKLGYIISNGTDNIIISKFIGISQVGLLSNYTTITNALTSFLSSFFNGFTASIGNLNTDDDTKNQESSFYQIILLSLYIYGLVSIEVILLSNHFIDIWLGSDYLLNFNICFALGLNIYIDGMRFANYTFRNTFGLFKKGRFTPLISSITNIILSILLVKPLGIFGVLIATAIARCFITTMYDPFLLHKYKFKTSSKRFYIIYASYFALFLSTLVICNSIINYINITGILGFLLKGIIIAIITLITFTFCIHQTVEYKELKKRIRNFIKK